ncbi:MAG TPA: PKD domain-containing protein [Luteibaculaceae bacterium]|nr:PKD domain-containing protein [Luteibaculaceae bacterium]
MSSLWAQDKYVIMGDRLFEKASYTEAIEKYKIAHVYAEDYVSAKKIAKCYFMLQRYREAIDWYQKLEAYSNFSADDLMGWVKCQLALQQPEVAQKKLDDLATQFAANKNIKMLRAYLESIALNPVEKVKGSARKVDYCVELEAIDDTTNLGPDVAIEWKFDDGTVKKGIRVNHCFTTPGKHSVVLTSIDRSFETSVRVDTVLPIFFLESMNFEITGLAWPQAPVKLDARKLAYRPNVIGVIWELGDGEIAFDEVYAHKYAKAGNYPITLTIIAEENGRWFPTGSIVQNWIVKDR